MHQAGWSEVWHAVLALVAQEPPFAQIAIATGVVFVAVMALEGLRSSVLAMIHAHRIAPPPLEAPEPAEPMELATPAAMPSRSFAAPREPRTARPKRIESPTRKFRELRPTIRRHSSLQAAE